MNATDEDHLGILSYVILNGNEKFRIDNTSGAIFVNSELNFETTNKFSLLVEATDGM